MVQNSQVVTGEANRISPRSAGQEDYLTIAERAIPPNRIDQTSISEGGEKTRVSGTSPRSANALVKIVKWLNHLGSGRIDDSYLDARHHVNHNFRAKGIGL